MSSDTVSMFYTEFNLVTYLGEINCILLGCYNFLKGTVLYEYFLCTEIERISVS